MSRAVSRAVDPQRLVMDIAAGTISHEGPTLVRRLSDLEGLFRDRDAWRHDLAEDDRVVYQVSSSPVPEADRDLPQSITTILPGDCAGETTVLLEQPHDANLTALSECVLLMIDARAMRFETLRYARDPLNPLNGDALVITDLSGHR